MAARRRERRLGKASTKRKRSSKEPTEIDRRAASIPPPAVHELFDTSEVDEGGRTEARGPAAPKVPHVSKPPPPPRPHHTADDLAEEVELELEPDSTPDAPREVVPLLTPPPVDMPSAVLRERERAAPRALILLGVAAAIAAGVALVSRGESSSAGAAFEAADVDRGAEPGVADRDTSSLERSRTNVAARAARDVEAPEAVGQPEPAPAPESSARTSSPEIPDHDSAAGADAATALPAPAARPAKPAARDAELPPFDAEAAGRAISKAFSRAGARCRKEGDPKGPATATITYAPSGRVTSAVITGPFAGTAIGGCVASTLRGASVPAFSGDYLTVKRTMQVE